MDNRKLKDIVGVIPESKEADIIKKTALYIATYVLAIDQSKMERLKVSLNMMLPTSTSEDNVKMYEKRYNVSKDEKAKKGKKNSQDKKELKL